MPSKSRDDTFITRTKEILVPALRDDGFRGSFPKFVRITGDLIHEVCVQGWRYGGERTINLSIGFTFIQPYSSNLRNPDTEYSYRIGTSNGRDRWWRYANLDDTAASELADEMVSVFHAEAPTFFERFAAFPDSFIGYSPHDFVNAPLSSLPPRIGGGRLIARDCWVFMQIWQQLDNDERAAEFAETGLEHIGNASHLKADFMHAISSVGGSG
jgi:hypothetical protein